MSTPLPLPKHLTVHGTPPVGAARRHLHVRQVAVCLERCFTSDLLETEVRERNATSSRPALVASTTACRVQTVGPRLPLSA